VLAAVALIPPTLLDVVVALGLRQADGSDRWIGTGFLYNRVVEDLGEGQYSVRGYLVTNRHVANCAPVLSFLINPRRLPPARGQIEAVDSSTGVPNWFFHPDPQVDVAVTGILHGHLKKLGLVELLAPLHDRQAFTVARMREEEVLEGDDVFVIGFPMEIVSRPRARPLVRAGCIARVSDLYDEPGDTLILDAHVYPGNSGGPAFLPPPIVSVTARPPRSEGGLLGIVYGYHPYVDEAYSLQTMRPRIVFEENSGLTLVHTVDCINEAIDELEAVHPLPAY
jgi:S1-C subfamily serine protease